MASRTAKSGLQWEPAHDALQRLYPFHGGYYATKLMLADMLKDGELTAMAGQRWMSTAASLTAAWRSRDEADIDEDILLDASDFGWSRYWNEDLANWRWKENRFVLTRAKKMPKRTFLVDVAFRREQVSEMMPSNRKGVGGAPIRVESMAKINIALIELAKLGYFSPQPPGSATLKPRFKDVSELVVKVMEGSKEAYNLTQARKLLKPVYDEYFPRTQRPS